MSPFLHERLRQKLVKSSGYLLPEKKNYPFQAIVCEAFRKTIPESHPDSLLYDKELNMAIPSYSRSRNTPPKISCFFNGFISAVLGWVLALMTALTPLMFGIFCPSINQGATAEHVILLAPPAIIGLTLALWGPGEEMLSLRKLFGFFVGFIVAYAFVLLVRAIHNAT